MAEMTWTDAVEKLSTLIDEDAVWIDDGAENWEIDNLLDSVRANEDGELEDLSVTDEGITRIDDAGYLESIPVYRVRARPLTSLVDAWDLNDIEELRVLLATVDDPQDEGIDMTSLPSAMEVPELITSYPVWSIDSHGRALVGPAADQIEDLSEILPSEYLMWDTLPGAVRDYLTPSNTIGPKHGGVYDDSAREYYTRDTLIEQLEYEDAPQEVILSLRFNGDIPPTIISWTDGRVETYKDLVSAMDAIISHHRNAVFCDDHGDEVVPGEDEYSWDEGLSNPRILVWEDETYAELDDGENAIAAIYRKDLHE